MVSCFRNLVAGLSFLVEMSVDADMGSGADSIQSYVGFDFDLDRLGPLGGNRGAWEL